MIKITNITDEEIPVYSTGDHERPLHLDDEIIGPRVVIGEHWVKVEEVGQTYLYAIPSEYLPNLTIEIIHDQRTEDT